MHSVYCGKKKMYEGQRDQLYDQQFNVEQVAFTQESMKDTADQVRAMQAANKGLKTAFKSKDLDIDKIEALQEEMADLMDMNTEIQESLARQYAVPDDLDEETLLEPHGRIRCTGGRPSSGGGEWGSAFLSTGGYVARCPCWGY